MKKKKQKKFDWILASNIKVKDLTPSPRTLATGMIGTSGPVLGRYERGEITPSVEVAKKLAEAFGVTLDYLVDESGAVAEVTDRDVEQNHGNRSS